MNGLLFTITCLCSLWYANAQRTPTIIAITPDQVKNIGGIVELSCSVIYIQGYTVLWKKLNAVGNDAILLSTDTTPFIRDSRFSLRYDTASTTYTLQIKDLQDTDAGIYKCQIVISQNSQISKQVRVTVQSPPLISDNSSSTVVVSENNPVKLECYANGSPKPQVSWKRENNAMLPTGGSVYKGNILKINNVHKEDRGTYYCTADNKVGKSVKRSIAVEIEFAPIVTPSRIAVGQALHFDADLECRVEAYPAPQITWIKDGYQLSNNQHYKISQFTAIGEFTDTTLRIISAEARQYGTYLCKAVNKLGESQASVEFYETEDAVCPPACGSGHYSSGVVFAPKRVLILVLVVGSFTLFKVL